MEHALQVPWNTSSLPWCKVDARTCQYPTRQGKVYSKGPFNLCLAQNDTKTVDTRAHIRASHTELPLPHLKHPCEPRIYLFLFHFYKDPRTGLHYL